MLNLSLPRGVCNKEEDVLLSCTDVCTVATTRVRKAEQGESCGEEGGWKEANDLAW